MFFVKTRGFHRKLFTRVFSAKSLEDALLARIRTDAHIKIHRERPLVHPFYLNGVEDVVEIDQNSQSNSQYLLL